MKTQHDTNESISLYDNYKINLKPKDTDKKFYFIFADRELLLIDNQLPLLKDLNELDINEEDVKNCIYFPSPSMRRKNETQKHPKQRSRPKLLREHLNNKRILAYKLLVIDTLLRRKKPLFVCLRKAPQRVTEKFLISICS